MKHLILKNDGTEYESIGFVYPVYAFGPPNKVYNFIKNLNLPKNKATYYYTIPNYGFILGNGILTINRLLSEKIKLDYAFAIKTAHNSLYQKSELQKKLFKQTDKDIELIIENIKKRKRIKFKREKIIPSIIYNTFMPMLYKKDKKYNTSEDCIGCGVCEQVCPVSNIKLKNKRPVFLHHCEQCVACIQFCPTKALNYSKASSKIKPYLNPNISCQEFIKNNLNKQL